MVNFTRRKEQRNRTVRISIGKILRISALFVVCLMTFTSWALAADVSEINSKLDALQKEIAELKANSVTKDNVVTGGATRGSFRLPGTNTSMTIGGFVKGTFIWSDKSAGAGSLGDQAVAPSLIPVGPNAGANEKSQITFHARQSQLWFQTFTPSKYGPVTSHFEGDFFGPVAGSEVTTNGHSFRIRQAYGTIGPFTAGQFWSTALSWIAFPEFMDFGGPVGIVGVRQVGLRWSGKFGGAAYSVSAENPETYLSGTTTVFPDDDKFPDVVGKVTFKLGGNTFDAAGVVRSLHIDIPGTVDSTTGWGAIFSGNIPAFGKDDFKFQVHRGEGFGRYIGGIGTMTDGVLINGKIEKITTTGGYLSYRHIWSPTFRSSLILSTVKATDPPQSPGTITNRASSAFLNFIWYPIPSVQIGPEFIYAERRIENGDSGHIKRVQFSARYNFF